MTLNAKIGGSVDFLAISGCDTNLYQLKFLVQIEVSSVPRTIGNCQCREQPCPLGTAEMLLQPKGSSPGSGVFGIYGKGTGVRTEAFLFSNT